MKLSSWGRFPSIENSRIQQASTETIHRLLQQPTITPRGLGRSYGDSALGANVVSSSRLDKFISFDSENGLLHCQSGVSMGEILAVVLPQGWFLPVLPGTQYVTVGGAISSDIHGKNHHIDGCFSECVEEFTLALAEGEFKVCSRHENSELFHGACGGMGLLGFIIDAKIKLRAISSAYLSQQNYTRSTLQEAFDTFEETAASPYSVAWLDCVAKGKRLGRSILYTGRHVDDAEISNRKQKLMNSKVHAPSLFTVPFSTPSAFLNRYSMGLFNELYYQLGSRVNDSANLRKNLIHYQKYFFPLDRIKQWNRLYGRNGFLQYQFVVPTESAYPAIKAVLQEITSQGKGSFLCVLKKFGASNTNLLSFPEPGYTLTLDFKHQSTLFPMLDKLDAIILAHGGRLYLAKDARMSKDVFRSSYPNWQAFTELKQKVDPNNKFVSEQAKRIGLLGQLQ